ncbi:MAG: hypothetical protein H7336_03670 [Bacteriovorax sp.]|nr:hypothetical protein [Bacteriovorax sp.]
MSFNPITSSTDYSTLTAEQIIAQKQKIAEETRKLDIVLKEKMEEQRNGFVQNVAEQIKALEIMPHDFIDSLKTALGQVSGASYTPFEIFGTIPDTALEEWFSEFNELKNTKNRAKKTPFFKIAKNTVKGISSDKFSTIYYEDIKGGEKGLKALADKIAPTREEAVAKLFDTIAKDDRRVTLAFEKLYPEIEELHEVTNKLVTKAGKKTKA